MHLEKNSSIVQIAIQQMFDHELLIQRSIVMKTGISEKKSYKKNIVSNNVTSRVFTF